MSSASALSSSGLGEYGDYPREAALSKLAVLIPFLLSVLLSACTSPTPTGTIAFSSDRDGNADIYLMNADRSSLGRLTHDPASDNNPACSRDAAPKAAPAHSPEPGFDLCGSFCYICLTEPLQILPCLGA